MYVTVKDAWNHSVLSLVKTLGGGDMGPPVVNFTRSVTPVFRSSCDWGTMFAPWALLFLDHHSAFISRSSQHCGVERPDRVSHQTRAI